MGLKNNFSQAFKELMKKEGFVGKNLSEEAKKDSSLDGYLGQNSAPAPAPSYDSEIHDDPDETKPKEEEFPAENEVLSEADDSSDEDEADVCESQKTDEHSSSDAEDSNDKQEPQTSELPAEPQKKTAQYPVRQIRDNDETTVISKNMVITGGTVSGFSNLKVDGGFKGDIKITKDVDVTGTFVGTIECNNASLLGSSVQGTVNAKGTLLMDRDSVLLGDVNVSNLDVNGRIKGNIAVSGKAAIRSEAVILGDIVASTIAIQDGAVIQGYVKTTFLQDESSSNVFPDAITVNEE